MEGFRMTLSGIRLVRNEIKHSDADTRILWEGEVRKAEIIVKRSGSLRKVSSGSIWEETSYPLEMTAIHGGSNCESDFEGSSSERISRRRGSLADDTSSTIPAKMTSKISNAAIVKYSLLDLEIFSKSSHRISIFRLGQPPD